MQTMNGNGHFVNLGEVTDIPHTALFTQVAAVIAEDTVQTVNADSAKVVPANTFYSKYGKRLIDIVVSAVALLLLSPVNLLLAICTFFDVGRPIIFKQKRIGRDGKTFTIVKFRNMTNETDENGELLPPDKRVTRFGKIVRKTSLDELLNFWSIFVGDMSLIGPRPLAYEYFDRYCERHKMRYAVRPGLECPMITKLDRLPTWSEQFENDVYYVEHVSLWLDIKMIFLLVQMVFNRKSSEARGNAVRGSFMGYAKDGSTINSREVPKHYFDEAVARIHNMEPIHK